MFKTFSLVLLGLAVVSPQAFAAVDDDLFSDVRVDSVYESKGDAAVLQSPAGIRVTSSDDLKQLVREAGFEPGSDGRRVVTTTRKLEPWSFPVFITLAEDEKHLGIVLALSSVTDPNQVTAAQLLKLMDANRLHAPTQFSFSAARKRTELFFLLPNRDVTGDILRDEINRMAILAKDTESIWKLGGSVAVTAEAESPSTPAVSKPAPKLSTEASITGRWSAARSAAEAFAVQFNEDGTFVLVYIKDGKQTRSTGKFARTNGQLSLNGADGVKLSGSFDLKSEQEFQFQPQKSAAALTFKKAK